MRVVSDGALMPVTFLRNETQQNVTRQLNDSQRRAAQLICLGLPQSRVAHVLGVREATISAWRRLPEFESYLDELRADARESYRSSQAALLHLAVGTVSEVMLTGSDELRLKAALAVMARSTGEAASTPPPAALAVTQAILNALRRPTEHEHGER